MWHFLNFKRCRKGFTLIEMLVTLGIIVALSSMILVYSRQSENVSSLIREGDQLVFELRRVQNQAMLVLQEDGEEKQICGWGIYLEQENLPQEKFALFTDLCLTGSSAGNGRYDEGEEAETINLSRGVEIFSSNVSSITFIPPDPRVEFYPETGAGVNANIRIRLKNQSDTYYEIEVSEFGQVYKELLEV